MFQRSKFLNCQIQLGGYSTKTLKQQIRNKLRKGRSHAMLVVRVWTEKTKAHQSPKQNVPLHLERRNQRKAAMKTMMTTATICSLLLNLRMMMTMATAPPMMTMMFPLLRKLPLARRKRRHPRHLLHGHKKVMMMTMTHLTWINMELAP
eukprot:PhF_6_TR15990/c0_g1_i1/m.25084